MTSLEQAAVRDHEPFFRGPAARQSASVEDSPILHLGNLDEQTGRPALSVVVPAYNEVGDVQASLQYLDRVIDGLVPSYEIIVVDDGSIDGTSAILQAMADHHGAIKYVTHDINHGKGHAIKSGCQWVSGERVLFVDADGDINPGDIAAFLERMEADDADIVIGSKRHPESSVSYPLIRRVLSMGYGLLVKALFRLDVTDTQVGMKLLRREVVEEVMPLVLVKRYAFDVELLAVAVNRGYTVTEAPVSIDFNMGSNIDWKEVARIGWDTAAVFYRLHLLRYYDRIEDSGGQSGD